MKCITFCFYFFAEAVKKEKNSDMQYHIGTMIEIPRAALTADGIAEEAEYALTSSLDTVKVQK